MGKQNKIYLILFALVVFALPFFLRNNYHLMVLNISALNILVVIGLNLLMGFAGQISLGHAAFFGLGAYLSGILTATYGFPVWPTIFLAMALTAGVAFGIGIPTLKLEGHYLVMATLGFNVIVYIVMLQLEPVTGGPSGFSAAILGGYGSMPGAVIGGLLLGVLESLGAGLISSEYKDALAFLILLIVLFFKPTGILGKGSFKRV